jgi:acyl-coenzyme A synthetase/AMP-(fatty) acid ligase
VTASQAVMPLDDDAGVAVEMLTSGTTGKPKRIPIRFDTLEKAMAGLIAPGDKAAPDILAFPVGNISGLYYLVPSCVNVHPLVLLEKFSLDAWIDAVKRHRPAYCAVPPAAIRMMLDADVAPADVSSLTAVGVGAAPLDPEVQRQFEQRYGIPVLIGYGATEFGGVVAAWTLEDHQQFGAAKRGSVGRARPGAQLRIVDPADSRVLPAGAIGVLQAQVERIGPDWMSTTDLASIDEDGFLFLHGRSDEVINRGGFKIEPQKVETVLRQHPAVAEAAVVGCADPRLGQVPMAAIELRSGAERPTQEQIDAWMRQHLRPQEVPAGYLIVDSLPRTPSFKVRRAGVRELFDANQP